jgi:4,5-dihydroxyphthalate decarboxylase
MTVHDRAIAAGEMVSDPGRPPEIIESGGTARLHLTLATTDYDHVRDLMSGVVRPDGIALTSFVLPVEEVFFRFIKNREWDVSEMSFGKFIGFASLGNSPFIGIPVFP